jgi:hypothetical protein
MNTKQQVNKLWNEMREAINNAYNAKPNDDETYALRDYVENQSMCDALIGLLDAETANEGRHRNGRPTIKGFSSETAAKLIIMGNVADGSVALTMPSAIAFLVWRKTAAESRVLGFLAAGFIRAYWYEDVKKLDYAQLMGSK